MDLFVEKIRQLSAGAEKLPPWRKEKIRIAILDTGIDSDDILIGTALENGRIQEARGFVGDDKDFNDKHGHGTHVTRLLLRIAPTAELYVAKISDSKHIDAKDLHRIPKVMRNHLSRMISADSLPGH
jgi:hypothetical protein